MRYSEPEQTPQEREAEEEWLQNIHEEIMDELGLTLEEARRTKGLVFELKPTEDKYTIELLLANAGNAQMRVNCLGSILKPSKLFVIGGEKDDWVNLRSGEKRTWVLRTICLDERLKDPDLSVQYQPSKEEASKDLLKAARTWRINQSLLGDDNQGLLPGAKDPRDFKWVQQVAWGYAKA